MHILPEAKEKEDDGTQISQDLIDKMAEVNLLACRLGPGKHLRGRTLFGGVVKGEEYDYFHDLIVSQEIVRTNMRGFQDGNMAGMTISLTAVHQWCRDEELRERVSQEVLSGKKKICLAVTEAFAGSDVAGLRTTATLSEDGEFYVVNGTKKVRKKKSFLLFSLFIHTDIFLFFFSHNSGSPTASSATTSSQPANPTKATPSSSSNATPTSKPNSSKPPTPQQPEQPT